MNFLGAVGNGLSGLVSKGVGLFVQGTSAIGGSASKVVGNLANIAASGPAAIGNVVVKSASTVKENATKKDTSFLGTLWGKVGDTVVNEAGEILKEGVKLSSDKIRESIFGRKVSKDPEVAPVSEVKVISDAQKEAVKTSDFTLSNFFDLIRAASPVQAVDTPSSVASVPASNSTLPMIALALGGFAVLVAVTAKGK